MASVTTDRRFGVNSNMAIKVPCKVASTGNLTLSGEQTIDGVSVTDGDRVLAKNQTDASENGIYRVQTTSWVRAPDWDGSYDVTQGTLVPIAQGTTNANTIWRVTTSGTITVDTTEVAFSSLATADASNVSYTPTVGGVVSDVETKIGEVKSVTDFGALGDGVTDDTSALDDARDWFVTQSDGSTLVWPTGTYVYSASPNWAVDNGRLIAIGTVRLRCTGAGNNFTLDGGAAGGGVYNMEVGPFLIEGHDGSTNGAYVRAVHHSRVSLNVRGCGTASSGLVMYWCVANTVAFTASVNEEGGWYNDGSGVAKPAIGINIDKRGVGEASAYNNFITPIIEGTGVGINIAAAGGSGNKFDGGTAEACTTWGAIVNASSNNNKFIGMDFESNGTGDLSISGAETDIISCESDSLLYFGATAQGSKVVAGSYESIDIETGATGVRVIDTAYSRGGAGTFTNDGTNSSIRDVYNVTGANFALGTNAGRAAYNAEIRRDDISTSFTTSPSTWTNTSGLPVTIAIRPDGVVTDVTLKRTSAITGVTSDSLMSSTALSIDTCSGSFSLLPTDALVVTFTSTPTVAKLSQ